MYNGMKVPYEFYSAVFPRACLDGFLFFQYDVHWLRRKTVSVISIQNSQDGGENRLYKFSIDIASNISISKFLCATGSNLNN